MTKPSPAWIARSSRSTRCRQILGIDQILQAHLQQLRRRALDDLAKSIIDEAKAPGRVDLRDADDRLAEHGAQHLLLLRSLPSTRLRTATSALSARPTPDVLIMNMTSGRNEFASDFCPAKGPPPAKAPQSAKHDRTSAVVAVSRWSPPQRRPQQRQGGQEAQRAPSDALLDQRTEGERANGKRRDQRNGGRPDLVRVEGADIADRPKHEDRRNDERPHHVAQPPRDPEGDEARPVGVTGNAQADHADGRADHRAGPEADERKLADAGRRVEGSATIGPDVDQIAGRERRKRVARRDRRGACDRAQTPRRPYRSARWQPTPPRKWPAKSANPATAPRQGKSGGWPDRDRARMECGERQAYPSPARSSRLR